MGRGAGEQPHSAALNQVPRPLGVMLMHGAPSPSGFPCGLRPGHPWGQVPSLTPHSPQCLPGPPPQWTACTWILTPGPAPGALPEALVSLSFAVWDALSKGMLTASLPPKQEPWRWHSPPGHLRQVDRACLRLSRPVSLGRDCPGKLCIGQEGRRASRGKGRMGQDAQDPREETAAPVHPGCWDPGLYDAGLTPGAHLCKASLPEQSSRTGTSRPWQIQSPGGAWGASTPWGPWGWAAGPQQVHQHRWDHRHFVCGNLLSP